MQNVIVKEHPSDKYSPRTYYNAKSADLTVAFATDFSTAGERCTRKAADGKYVACPLQDDSDTDALSKILIGAIDEFKAKTINVAGNGIYTLSEIGCSQSFINDFIFEVIAKTHAARPISKIFTGGQTGVDLAGAVAAVALGIPAEITLPKGFMQRDERKIDSAHSAEEILNQIADGVSGLAFQAKRSRKP